MGWNLGGSTDGAQASDPGFGEVLRKQLVDAVSYMQGTFTTTAVTASATETQAAATLLNGGFNEVLTAGANDAVKLPQGKPGMLCVIANNSGQTIKIFPNVADTINDAAQNAQVDAADNTLSIYACMKQTTAGAPGCTWYGGPITFES